MSEESAMPGSEARAAAPVLRVQAPSRLAFAGTTLALVTLASLATAALVNESTSVAPGTAAPGLQSLPPLVTGGGNGVVVDRAPGTFTLTPPRTAVAPAVRSVVDALTGGAQGSSPLPPVALGGSGFPLTGVLRGTTGTPVTVPVTVPVVAPELPPVATPHSKPPVVRPHVPSVTPEKVVKAAERAAEQAAKAAARAVKKAEHAKHEHGKKPTHAQADRSSSSEQDEIENRRFHEQAQHAKHARKH